MTAELRPGQVVGKCRVERELGRGGMGAVYLARHQTLDVPVALKILPPSVAERHPDYAERFLREARMAARLRHPNVVAIMDADKDAATGFFYMVAEYVDGGSVGDRLRKGPLTEQKATAIVSAVAKALQAAASQGIIHRDIKPDNILITRDGRVKLADLGLAKSVGDDAAGITQSSAAMGTPHYMSPEQIQDAKNVDTRSDIYSLGATFFHLLTGGTPFTGREVFQVLSQVMSAPTPDPRERNPAITEPTARICQRMMERDRDRRYQSATELLKDIQSGGPVGIEMEAAPGPMSITPQPSVVLSQGPVDLAAMEEVERKPVKINPAWIIAASAILLVLLAGRMMLKSREPVPDRRPPVEEATDTAGGTSGSSESPVTSPVNPPVDTPFTLTEGIALALSFEPETWMVQDGHGGYRDLSGNRILAFRAGGTSGPGRIGEAVVFAGQVSDYLSLPPFEERAVAAWIQAAEARPCVWYDGGSTRRLDGFLLGIGRPGSFSWPITSDALVFGFWQLDALFPSPDISTGWHHVVASWDGANTVRVAVDGVFLPGLVAGRGAATAVGPQPLRLPETPHPAGAYTVLGRSLLEGNPSLQPFAGSIDELAIWTRALTEAEMKELHGYAAKGRSYCEEIEAKLR